MDVPHVRKRRWWNLLLRQASFTLLPCLSYSG